MPNKKTPFPPSSRTGKWAAGLTAFFLVVSPLLYFFDERLRLLPDGFSNTVGPAGILAVLMGFVLSLAALFKNKDHSITVFICAAVGLFVVGFILVSMAGDLLF